MNSPKAPCPMASPEVSPQQLGRPFPNTLAQQPQFSEQSRLQILWDEHVKDSTPFVRYKRTVVLLVSWADEVTDLKTEEEVNKLKATFTDTYKFKVETQQLDHKQRPQLQMTKHLSNFYCDYDDEQTLLIIYYAGHGFAECGPDGKLELHGNTTQAQEKQLKWNTVIWEQAEQVLFQPKSDILLIFDCCQAGVLARKLPTNRFQLLAACTENAVTKPPGNQSFTTALIWALENLKHRDSFFVNELRMEIRHAPHFPGNQIPVLVDRDHASLGNIVIAPMRSNNTDSHLQTPRDDVQDLRGDFINLRFHFGHQIHDTEFIEIAKVVNGLLLDKRIKARRVAFLGKHSFQENLAKYTNYWKSIRQKSGKSPQISLKQQANHLSINTNVQSNLSPPTSVQSATTRSGSEDEESAPRQSQRISSQRKSSQKHLRTLSKRSKVAKRSHRS